LKLFGARIADGEIDFMIFFSDPLESRSPDPDIKALLRLAILWNIPIACNRASADFMISSSLMGGEYNRLIPDYEKYRTRKLDTNGPDAGNFDGKVMESQSELLSLWNTTQPNQASIALDSSATTCRASAALPPSPPTCARLSPPNIVTPPVLPCPSTTSRLATIIRPAFVLNWWRRTPRRRLPPSADEVNNRAISRIRIRIEPAIGEVKRYRIVKDKIRN
jgi:hypothetical protein